MPKWPDSNKSLASLVARPLSLSLVAVLVAVAVGSCRSRKPSTDDAAPVPDLEAMTEDTEDAGVKSLDANMHSVRIVYPSAPGSFIALVDDLRGSVLELRSSAKVSGGPASHLPGSGPSHVLGTAFVIDREGHLATSDHLITRAPEIYVRMPSGTDVVAKVVGRDAKLDLAILKIDVSVGQLKPVRYGDSDMVQVGEWVLALGNTQGGAINASAGIISAKGAQGRDSAAGISGISGIAGISGISGISGIAGSRTNYQRFLQTDATIDARNSGGPLLDMTGAVIGINTALAGQAREMRLAVPINQARQAFPSLIRDGSVARAWLGVKVHPVTAALASSLGLPGELRGALVSEVVHGGPCARAGVLPGDIVLKLDGQAVDHSNLPWLASTIGVGRQVPLLLWRDRREKRLTMVSEKMPQ